MSAIKGKKREQTEDFGKKIGMVEVSVIAINPSVEEYAEVLGIELKEESKAANYLGESNDGNNYVRVDFWLQTAKDGQKFKTSFFLEDKNRMNKDETKQQFINNIGVCSWAADEDTLPSWFAKRDYRHAYSGEEDFYAFLRNWLGGLDYRDDDTELQLSWKDLMKGKLNDLRSLIDGEYATNLVAMATVIIKGEGEDTKEYQGIYNKGFLPAYTMRHFNLVDYDNPEIQARIQAKVKDMKPHERFIKNASGEYGCKDIYSFRPISEYIAEQHFQASDDAAGGEGVADTGSEY
jgi:hypothetical protein